MSHLHVKAPANRVIQAEIFLPSSKSICNRALIVQAMQPGIRLHQVSAADDTVIMQRALKQNEGTIYLGNAGTCMRFLTAYYACKPGADVILEGEERMYQRPVSVLVNALKALGADISYLREEGFPPLHIRGRKLQGGKISVNAGISSQYLTALMLVAPGFEKGLEINMEGAISSLPYVDMTCKLMAHFGVQVEWNGTRIFIPEQSYQAKELSIEPDWSAASYWYEIAALSESCHILLTGLPAISWQGDAVILEWMKSFSVETRVSEKGLLLTKASADAGVSELDIKDYPDLSLTMAALAASLHQKLTLKNIESLRIKETDRVQALVNELSRLGFRAFSDENRLYIEPLNEGEPAAQEPVQTYGDHRMAMAFAPLALRMPEGIMIADPDVVVKSYPRFWDDLQTAGFLLTPGQ